MEEPDISDLLPKAKGQPEPDISDLLPSAPPQPGSEDALNEQGVTVGERQIMALANTPEQAIEWLQRKPGEAGKPTETPTKHLGIFGNEPTRQYEAVRHGDKNVAVRPTGSNERFKLLYPEKAWYDPSDLPQQVSDLVMSLGPSIAMPGSSLKAIGAGTAAGSLINEELAARYGLKTPELLAQIKNAAIEGSLAAGTGAALGGAGKLIGMAKEKAGTLNPLKMPLGLIEGATGETIQRNVAQGRRKLIADVGELGAKTKPAFGALDRAKAELTDALNQAAREKEAKAATLSAKLGSMKAGPTNSAWTGPGSAKAASTAEELAQMASVAGKAPVEAAGALPKHPMELLAEGMRQPQRWTWDKEIGKIHPAWDLKANFLRENPEAVALLRSAIDEVTPQFPKFAGILPEHGSWAMATRAPKINNAFNALSPEARRTAQELWDKGLAKGLLVLDAVPGAAKPAVVDIIQGIAKPADKQLLGELFSEVITNMSNRRMGGISEAARNRVIEAQRALREARVPADYAKAEKTTAAEGFDARRAGMQRQLADLGPRKGLSLLYRQPNGPFLRSLVDAAKLSSMVGTAGEKIGGYLAKETGTAGVGKKLGDAMKAFLLRHPEIQRGAAKAAPIAKKVVSVSMARR